ncbi:hypothetical protein AA18889_1225 [Acetobacter senegalensis DSM 18889]|nr:hypothetical protein AA18889_1225 [Acetobacter senegalensis DSM 18889]
MTPSLQQTQFLKRYIALSERPVPNHGPLSNLSIDGSWLKLARETEAELLWKITPAGIWAFWQGVKEHGAKAVMGKFVPSEAPKGIA